MLNAEQFDWVPVRRPVARDAAPISLRAGVRLLNPRFDLGRFGLRLRDAPRRALILDFDGTLSAFVPDRLAAVPYPGVREALGAIVSDGATRVAVVSGRPLAELDSRLGLPLELWGSHGIEHRTRNGAGESPEPAPELTALLGAVAGWIRNHGWEALLEPKPFGLALHARPDPALFRRAGPAVLARWSGPAREAGLEVRVFDSGVELRPAGRHKGQVIARVLSEVGEESPVAYLGDDETDEDGFAALSGRGLGVLVRPTKRPTRADAWLRPPDELLAFLAAWREATAGGSLEGLVDGPDRPL
jgi:trehalose-phosphatase